MFYKHVSGHRTPAELCLPKVEMKITEDETTEEGRKKELQRCLSPWLPASLGSPWTLPERDHLSSHSHSGIIAADVTASVPWNSKKIS
ncbi:hypothetical protein MHYP_G00290620 [Metynnis hypsauchen]